MRLSEYMAEEENFIMSFGYVARWKRTSASFNTFLEDRWAASIQHQGTSSRSQVSALVKGTIWILTRACFLVIWGGGVPREKLQWHLCKLCKERKNKHAGIQTMGLPANSVLPLNPFYCYTVNESAQSGQKQWKHTDWWSANLHLCRLVLWQGGCKRVTRQTRRKGTSKDTWKSR